MIASHELNIPAAIDALYDAIAPVPADGESPTTLGEMIPVADMMVEPIETAMDAAECVTTQTAQLAPAFATLDSSVPAEVASGMDEATAVAVPMPEPATMSALQPPVEIETATAVESEETASGNETEIASAMVTTPNLDQAMAFVAHHATAQRESLEETPATLIASNLAEATITQMDEVSDEPGDPSEPAAPCTVGQLVEIEPASVPESEAATLVHVYVATELANMPSAPCMDSSVTDTAAPVTTKIEATKTIEGDAPAVAHFERAVSVVADEGDVTPPAAPVTLAYESDVQAAARVSQSPAEVDTTGMDEDAQLHATVANGETAATAHTPITTAEWQAECAAHVPSQQANTPNPMTHAATAESAAPTSVGSPISTANPEPASMAAVNQDGMPVSQVPMANPMYAMALKFVERGIPVFPLFGFKGKNCACGEPVGSPYCSPGKHPRQLASFKGASVIATTIKAWFTHYGQVNYGIATGQEVADSGMMIVVVDIDAYKAEAQISLDALEREGHTFPDTAEVLTGGGGRHLYFLAKAGTLFDKTAGPGIDLKGIGGYVVGPGSMHASGLRYEWEASSDLFDGQEIAQMPQWMYDKFAKKIPVAASSQQIALPGSVADDDVTEAEMAEYKADLELISPMEYGPWVEVLMALKSRSESEQMFALANWWSKKAGYKSIDDVRATWKSIKAQGGITIKTLKRLADALRAEGVDISRILNEPARKPVEDIAAWPQPEPIHFGGEAVDYPLDALPELLKSAVVEAQAFAKAPVAMVASSAISTLSLAAQALYDVERAKGFTGPIGVFMLTVANSGERKTTLDGMFSAPIHDYEARCAMEAKSIISEYTADLAAWEAKRKGILDGIVRAAATKDSSLVKPIPHANAVPLPLLAPAPRLIGDLSPSRAPVADPNAVLRAHEFTQPVRPLVPRLIYADVTPEALKHNMAVEWPSAGIISSEGGAVLGGHGMKKDNQVGNMATLNEMWDGKPGRTDRKTTQAAVLKNARLTIAIQVQKPTLIAFIKGSNDLARGTGFLARYLVSWPVSTMGTRAFAEPPATWPMRDRFHQRISDILNSPQPIVDRELKPNTLTLSKEAKVAWVAFHDEIEFQLGVTGRYRPVCDVGSKAADNAARVAALFHVLEGEAGTICEAHMIAATRVVRWHLNESARLYGGLTVPPELEAAAKLNDWLVAHCKKELVQEIGFTELMRYGPNGLRKKADLEPPLEQLAGLGRVKVRTAPARTVCINPALLK